MQHAAQATPPTRVSLDVRLGQLAAIRAIDKSIPTAERQQYATDAGITSGRETGRQH